MDNKSIYYPVSWDDAADYTQALEGMDIPHAVEDPTDFPMLPTGQLAIVLPHLSVRQYTKVRQLFRGEGEHYPEQ
ncbi:hypothetical protein LOK74_18890 [Brevibacillus humidisoli]|uniref:hypothetical protein n=1 Tax=Brevibacillus humidisoli TaxID=2895522 RepID=UPI001E4A64AB|nr:hypothetical protein [Brevibacillus humidisoli]UFJ40080.1 hypothetical protein LOK74_18890 [Brevibacillus humidisoli]